VTYLQARQTPLPDGPLPLRSLIGVVGAAMSAAMRSTIAAAWLHPLHLLKCLALYNIGRAMLSLAPRCQDNRQVAVSPTLGLQNEPTESSTRPRVSKAYGCFVNARKDT